MVYKRAFNAEAEIRELRSDLKEIRKGSNEPPQVSDTTARFIRQRADKAMEIVDKQETIIVGQEARIDRLERLVEQLLRRGRIPCQEQSYSQSLPSPSLRSVSSY